MRRLQRLRRGRASGALDPGVARKGEQDADRLAFVAQIIEHDALGGRRDFLQPEGVGYEAIEARSPIGFEFGAAFAHLDLAALAFKLRVVGIEVEQRRQVAIPARVQPVDHQRNLIEIIRQIRAPNPRRYTLCRALTRLTESGDRREWTLNGLLSGTRRGISNDCEEQRFLQPVRLNTGTAGIQARRCPRHHIPKAMTTANASVNQVMAYCR